MSTESICEYPTKYEIPQLPEQQTCQLIKDYGKETILEVLEVGQGRRIKSEDQWVEHPYLICSWWDR